MRSIYLAIPEQAADQLRVMATREYRSPRQQAAILLIRALLDLDIEPAVRPAERAAR